MRILHTSDWHLGHTLFDQERTHEHTAFLEWLLDTIGAEAIDALIVAGDIFDTSNPSSEAQAMWYRFVAQARMRYPDLEIVAVGGNHDSASRLDAPQPLLDELRVHLVGGYRARSLDRLVIPLRLKGEVRAWVAAVPFLRPGDLDPVLTPAPHQPEASQPGDAVPASSSASDESAPPLVDPLIEGVRAVYARVLKHARAQRQRGQALIATGHCYMVSSVLSEMSERRILGGNQHALPHDIFPDDLAYVALGHLHRAQKVGRDHVRYSGSPLPLSLEEAGYAHQVVVAELDGEICRSVQALHVPRTVDIVRIPRTGSAPLAEVLDQLRALPARGDTPHHLLPYLHVHVELDRSRSTLRSELQGALEGRAARLLKHRPYLPGPGGSLADAAQGEDLRSLHPERVLSMLCERERNSPPSEALKQCFAQLLEQVQEAHA